MQRLDHQSPKGYVSEFEQFMNHFLEDHPAEIENRKKGWYIYWGRHVELDDLEDYYKNSIPMKGYVYR